MGRMIFDLTDDDRAALERVRIALGVRSHAEALRMMIRAHDAPATPMDMYGQPLREASPVAKRPEQPKSERATRATIGTGRKMFQAGIGVQLGPSRPKYGERQKGAKK